MNKKLLAAALSLAFAGVAQAQSNVTLYGIADGGLRFDKTSIGTLRSVNSGGESGSRWGLKGSEDLGGGLKAIFTLEQGFDLTDNASPQGNISNSAAGGVDTTTSTGSRIFSRNATVGLTGDFGTVKIGRYYSPYFLLWDSVDPMDAGLVGGAQNIVQGNVNRFDNGIYFDSANIAGFQFTVAEKFGKSATINVVPQAAGATANTSTKNAGNAVNINLTYGNGPLLVGYSWLSVNNAVDESVKNKSNLVVGSYDLGVVKLAAFYSKVKSSNTSATLLANTITTVGVTDAHSFMIGATVPLNAWKIFGEFGKITNKAASDAGLNKDANFLGLGTQYAASKRTDFYGSLGKYSSVGQNGVYTISDASLNGLDTAGNIAAGFNALSYQVGIRHKF